MPRLLADLTPLRLSPAYRRLWAGLGVSNLGSQLTVVAVGLQVYALTSSTFAVGVLGIAAFVPLVLLGLYGGALVDAFDRRKVALIASSALWVLTGLILLQAVLHLDQVWVLYVLVAFQSAAFAINNPARTAIIPRLVPATSLAAANALQTLSMSIALTVGPLAGAFLVAAKGFAWAYAIDFVLFTVALWALWRLPALPPVVASGVATGGDAPDPRSVTAGRRKVVGLASVLEGLRYLGTRPNVRMTFLLDLAAMILAMPRVVWPAVGVLYIGGGSTTTGWLNAAFAIGSVLASLLSGGLSQVHRQGRAVVVAVLSFACSTLLFGLVLVGIGNTAPDHLVVWGLLAAGVALALAGASDGVSAIFRQTILQSATPDDMRGRLQGVFIVVVAGGPRLGDLVTGGNASWLGEAWAVVVGSILCLVVVGLLVRSSPRFLAYDARHPEP
ncbi:MFS transporter [Luteimicrobium subarcticum]|uniref:Transmembrane secretion effector n=1 Tax=Luteimicrobium subarcticum TaxID=620910 RepID=A0A2M8WIX9_9MICO|nr:MFS transporter [Luteimicrobium subarcticum]PJI90897.1 transmembrane secretion effector [Luteimicrobium subarcticum]